MRADPRPNVGGIINLCEALVPDVDVEDWFQRIGEVSVQEVKVQKTAHRTTATYVRDRKVFSLIANTELCNLSRRNPGWRSSPPKALPNP